MVTLASQHAEGWTEHPSERLSVTDHHLTLTCRRGSSCGLAPSDPTCSSHHLEEKAKAHPVSTPAHHPLRPLHSCSLCPPGLPTEAPGSRELAVPRRPPQHMNRRGARPRWATGRGPRTPSAWCLPRPPGQALSRHISNKTRPSTHQALLTLPPLVVPVYHASVSSPLPGPIILQPSAMVPPVTSAPWKKISLIWDVPSSGFYPNDSGGCREWGQYPVSSAWWQSHSCAQGAAGRTQVPACSCPVGSGAP